MPQEDIEKKWKIAGSRGHLSYHTAHSDGYEERDASRGHREEMETVPGISFAHTVIFTRRLEEQSDVFVRCKGSGHWDMECVRETFQNAPTKGGIMTSVNVTSLLLLPY